MTFIELLDRLQNLEIPDDWPVLLWDQGDERWMTVRAVKPDDDRVVLLTEPFE